MKIEQWPHIPDEALHLATDEQFTRALREHGHTVKRNFPLITAVNKKTGSYVAWTPSKDGCEHPMSYRAQIIRTLVRLAFFAAVIVGALAWVL